MCDIAGYVGTRRAAPILLEMIKNEEGWEGGYYTGIATIHEGKIYYAKLTGDVNRLLAETNAASLPGNIGIIHSRSNSGGGDAWAHPFIGGKDGKEETAYVANGFLGYFADRSDEATQIAGDLFNRGYAFSSRVMNPVGKYPCLPDGSCAHVSEVMGQLITSRMDDGENDVQAMNGAFCQMPAEIVGLFLSLQNPDHITYSRVNFPMMLGFCDHGAYLATTAQAFPEDAGEPLLLPACSGGRVFTDHFEMFPYAAPPAKVAPMDARVITEATQVIESMLSEKDCLFSELVKAIRNLFAPSDSQPFTALAYTVLYSLKKQGRLDYVTEPFPGAQEGLTAPKFKISLKK